MLAAHHVSKSHGTSVVLDDVSVVVGPRARIGVVGPNGVGKSTLLRILGGMEAPDSGSVVRRPAELTVGYLPQEHVAEPGETVLDALARRTGVSAADAALQTAAADLSAERAGAADVYSSALERYLTLGGPDLPARAAEICEDLGLPAEKLEAPVDSLSGGQRARASLAAILLARFDVFLLDEPTNDLDFDGLATLERFVDRLDAGLVVVSHDREFLDRTIDRVLELDEHSHRATEFAGGWSAFLEERETARRHQYEAHERFTTERSRLLDRARRQRQWSQSGVARVKKKQPDNDKALRNARIEATEKQAAKVRITERALERLDEVEKPWEGWRLDLDVSAKTRSGDVVAELRDAVVERGSFRLGPVDLDVRWGDRVAITGANGSGKTTLLGAMLGTIPLTSGTARVGPSVVVGELDQSRAAFLGSEDLLSAFTDASGLRPGDARTLLAKFGLVADHVLRPAASLSPGERTRAVLALLMHKGANCLVLDEPTNHLDLPAIEQLEIALDGYAGTILLVSHDRALLDRVKTTRTVHVADGAVTEAR